MICSITILYKPTENIIINISTYIDNVDKMIIIDNSKTNIHNILKKNFKNNSKIIIVDNQKNLGIAKALNTGLDFANRYGFHQAFLMDQDSYVAPDTIKLLQQALVDTENTYIAAPSIIDINTKNNNYYGYKYINTCITSGSLINLKYFHKIGYHEEKLFIDFVDHEYCLRAKKLGYNIVLAKHARLYHKLGTMEEHKIFCFKFYPTNHSPLRRYYRARNSLYVWRKYFFLFPGFVLRDWWNFFKEYLTILLFEKKKFLKTKAILSGIRDSFINRFGEYNGTSFN